MVLLNTTMDGERLAFPKFSKASPSAILPRVICPSTVMSGYHPLNDEGLSLWNLLTIIDIDI